MDHQNSTRVTDSAPRIVPGMNNPLLPYGREPQEPVVTAFKAIIPGKIPLKLPEPSFPEPALKKTRHYFRESNTANSDSLMIKIVWSSNTMRLLKTENKWPIWKNHKAKSVELNCNKSPAHHTDTNNYLQLAWGKHAPEARFQPRTLLLWGHRALNVFSYNFCKSFVLT